MGVDELAVWRRSEFTEHPEPVGRTLFRLETLDEYGVASDGSDYERHRNGEPGPDPDRTTAWTRVLEAERARGLRRSRVHIVQRPLHPYLRFECEWGYVPNAAAGEDIQILDRTETPLTAAEQQSIDQVGDFWLLNGESAVVMHYDDTGRFVGAEHAADATPYRTVAAWATSRAQPFPQWWARHPDEHRWDTRTA